MLVVHLNTFITINTKLSNFVLVQIILYFHECDNEFVYIGTLAGIQNMVQKLYIP
jgi:hypothetical protein